MTVSRYHKTGHVAGDQTGEDARTYYKYFYFSSLSSKSFKSIVCSRTVCEYANTAREYPPCYFCSGDQLLVRNHQPDFPGIPAGLPQGADITATNRNGRSSAVYKGGRNVIDKPYPCALTVFWHEHGLLTVSRGYATQKSLKKIYLINIIWSSDGKED